MRCLFRPLPAALAPLLQGQLDLVLENLCTAFPPARACLEAAADGSGSVQLQKMAAFRGRVEGLAAIRDEHDGDVSAELAEGKVFWPFTFISTALGACMPASNWTVLAHWTLEVTKQKCKGARLSKWPQINHRPGIRDARSEPLCADGGVARPRVLVSGSEGFGQDHLAPALLHALEGLPVHSIGLPALLSDASARCYHAMPFVTCNIPEMG